MSHEPSTTLFRTSPRCSKNLLIVNKGPGAVPIPREGQRWDLLEIYFMPADIKTISENPTATDAEHVVFETSRNMRKYEIVKAIFEQNNFWRGYDAFLIADDDLVATGCTIGDMFDLFATTGCRIGQPALTQDSYFAHMVTVKNDNFIWRKTNFVEVMCPLFSREALETYLPMLNGTGSGLNLDYFWSYNEWLEGRGLAMLDQTPIKHTRPVGGGIAYEGLKEIEKEVTEFMNKRGIPWYPMSCFDGVRASRALSHLSWSKVSLLGYANRFDRDDRYLYYVVHETAIYNSMAALRRIYGDTDKAKALLHIAAVGLFMGSPHYRRHA